MVKNILCLAMIAGFAINLCIPQTGFAKKSSAQSKKKSLSKKGTNQGQFGLQKTVSNETIKKSGYSRVNLSQTTIVGTVHKNSIDELINEVSGELAAAKIKRASIGTIIDGIKKQNLFVKEFEETYKDHIQGFISSEKKQDSISVRLIILSSSFQSANLLKRMLGENQDPAFLVSLCNQRKSEILTEWKTNPFLA